VTADLNIMTLYEAPGFAPCWVCGQPADYISLSWEAAICGGICDWAAWEAMRLHDTPWRAW
jgi:hypothetical protein